MNFSLVLNFPRAEGVRSLRLANPADPTHINNATNRTTTTATTTKVPGNGGGTDPRSSINYVFFYNSSQCIRVRTALNDHKFIRYDNPMVVLVSVLESETLVYSMFV